MHDALKEDEEMKRECEEMVQGMYTIIRQAKEIKFHEMKRQKMRGEREREESTSEQQSGEVGGNILDF